MSTREERKEARRQNNMMMIHNNVVLQNTGKICLANERKKKMFCFFLTIFCHLPRCAIMNIQTF